MYRKKYIRNTIEWGHVRTKRVAKVMNYVAMISTRNTKSAALTIKHQELLMTSIADSTTRLWI